jgi:hypothetical protein
VVIGGQGWWCSILVGYLVGAVCRADEVERAGVAARVRLVERVEQRLDLGRGRTCE